MSVEPADVPPADAHCPFQAREGTAKAFGISLAGLDWSDDDAQYLLHLPYTGDVARLYLNGRLVADDFWKADDWFVGLSRWREALAKPDADLIVVINPWKRDQPVFVENPPIVTDDLTAELPTPTVETLRTIRLNVQ